MMELCLSDCEEAGRPAGRLGQVSRELEFRW